MAARTPGNRRTGHGAAPWSALDSTFVLQVTGVPAGSFAAAWYGFSRLSWSGVRMPVDLAPIGAPGCVLRTSPEFLSFVAGNGGIATWTLPVPANGALLGVQAFVQAAVIDPPANAFGATVTNAAEVRIGGR